MLECHQEGCDNPPSHRYTWPGKSEQHICFLCAMKVEVLARTIGLPLQFIPLTTDDYLKEASNDT